jgi:hypothetical protein
MVGTNLGNLIFADNFASFINLLSDIGYQLSVVRLTTFKKFLINYNDDTNESPPSQITRLLSGDN